MLSNNENANMECDNVGGESLSDNGNCKLYVPSSLTGVCSILALWTFRIEDPDKHRLWVFSKTLQHYCDKENTWNLFNLLAAKVVHISKNLHQGPQVISIDVETPKGLSSWLAKKETYLRLLRLRSEHGRLGLIVAKLYDFAQVDKGQLKLKGPKQFINLNDYVMAVMIRIGYSPFVSVYKDIQVNLRMRDGSLQQLPLRQFIPEKVEFGVSKFMHHYGQVIIRLFNDQMMEFEEEIPEQDVGKYDKNEIRIEEPHNDLIANLVNATFNDEKHGEVKHVVSKRRVFHKVCTHPLDILKNNFDTYVFPPNERVEMEEELLVRMEHCSRKRPHAAPKQQPHKKKRGPYKKKSLTDASVGQVIPFEPSFSMNFPGASSSSSSSSSSRPRGRPPKTSRPSVFTFSNLRPPPPPSMLLSFLPSPSNSSSIPPPPLPVELPLSSVDLSPPQPLSVDSSLPFSAELEDLSNEKEQERQFNILNVY